MAFVILNSKQVPFYKSDTFQISVIFQVYPFTKKFFCKSLILTAHSAKLLNSPKDVIATFHFATSNSTTEVTLNKVDIKEHFLSDEKLEDMIIAQGMVVFFAGNDTTSSTLSVVSYFLAQHQDLQEKVYKEVMVSIFQNFFRLTGSFSKDSLISEAIFT